MAARKDIVAVSIPFTAGVVVAAVLPPGVVSHPLMALCSGAVMAISFFLAARSDDGSLSTRLLFLAIGLTCGINHAVFPGMDIPTPMAASSAREALIEFIERTGFRYGDTSALLKSLLCGDRSGLSPSIKASFRASGASHILALSGLHLGILYGIISSVMRLMGNTVTASLIRAGLTIALSGFYVTMTGASPSIVRAFLFITVNEISRLMPGRERRPIAVLCTASMIQLTFNPGLIGSVAFQLSYLAMLGIFMIFPVLQSWYPEGAGPDPVRKIWTSMALSLSCQLFTAPVVWYHFHTFPKYFLLTNLIALPISEALITAGAVTLTLEAFGLCPEMIKGLCDILAQALIFCLGVIAGM